MNESHIYDIDEMHDNEIVELMKHIVESTSGCGTMRRIMAKQNKPLQDAICRLTSFLRVPEYSFVNIQTRIYMLIHDMQEKDFPRCIHCGKVIKKNVISVHQGFPYEACSMKCAAQSEQRKQKIEATNIERHGKAKWSNGEKISESLKNMDPEKRKQTTAKFKKTRQQSIDKNPNFWKDRDAKSRQTKLDKHGNETFNNGEQISMTKRQKLKEDPLYYKKQQEQGRQTRFERYGDENFNNRDKASTTLQKHIEENPDFWKEKDEHAKQTRLERYGDENWNNSEQQQRTCLERYGSTCYFTSEIGKKTCQQTCLDRYGATSFMSSDEGRKMMSIRHAKQTYAKVSDPSNEVEPLFSLDDVITKTPLTMFRWRCKKCGNIFESPINFVQARNSGQFARCLKCHPIKHIRSKKQADVFNFIASIYGGQMKMNDRTQIYPYEIDIYLPDLKLGIEFDGLYWHSAYGGANDAQHLYKTNLCKDKGIQLIHLFEDEWDNRKNQCKSKLEEIIKQHNDVLENFSIQHVDKEKAQRFFDNNSYDIFAKASSTMNIALVGKTGKTYAMLACTKSNDKLLIGDFCCANGYHYQNSYETLINYAKDILAKHHHCNIIQISIDNRWLINYSWLESFSLVNQTNPSFWLIDFKEKYVRCQKGIERRILQKFGIKENESIQSFMDANSMTYVADCGNLIYQMQV